MKFYENDQIHLGLTSLTKSERARRAQSQQKVRAQQQNKERQARGLAMKKRAVQATASDLERILRQPMEGSLESSRTEWV